MTPTIAHRVRESLSIRKGDWYRKDGSHWMNDRGFIEPYREIGRIPSHNPDNPDFPEKGGGGTKSERDLSDSERLKLLLEMEPAEVTQVKGDTINSKLSIIKEASLSGTSRLYQSGLQTKVANPLDPHQLTKLGGGEKLPKDKLYQWVKNASKNQDDEMDNNQNITKGFFGFGKKPSANSNPGGGSAPRQGLVKKQIIDSRGRRQTKWVRPQDIQTPIEKKREEAKKQRKKVTHLNHSEEDKKKIEEITKRHKEFENKAREQRRVFGAGPQLPKPGLIMRVYARGKVNVGGMLAEVQKIAEDGKSVIAMLTSGKTYEFPLEQLHFAKSILYHQKESNHNE